MSKFGSYSEEDVVFLLKDISQLIVEEGNEEREMKIQSGSHYSEMIPIEREVSEEYISLYRLKLDKSKEKLAFYIGLMTEKILRTKGEEIVLVSLARAGTPIGILAKRYLKNRYNIDIKHYTISIIRDKGIDVNAIKYIIENNPSKKNQFVDGWTGKGTISKELYKSCYEIEIKLGINIDSSLAVLSDPSGYSSLYGTREDFLIPSACLNSTVSGLVSRTVVRDDIIGKNDFHGAKYYTHLADKDESVNYIETISSCFNSQYNKIDEELIEWEHDIITKCGDKDILVVKEKYNISNINFIKPGIGETTRVLLRRIPDRIIVKNINDESLKHILVLSKEKDIPVEELNLASYNCCGIIKNIKDI